MISISTPVGQRGLDFLDAFLHAADDLAGVLADQHHHQSGHRFAAAIASYRTLTRHRGDVNVGHVADQNRCAIRCATNDDLP